MDVRSEDERDQYERGYIEGMRSASIAQLRAHVSAAIGAGGETEREVQTAQWVIERQEAVAKLREVCADYGDNDWPDELQLADVIENHLAVYISGEEGRSTDDV